MSTRAWILIISGAVAMAGVRAFDAGYFWAGFGAFNLGLIGMVTAHWIAQIVTEARR